MLKYELGAGQPNFSRAVLKDSKLLALRICNSSLSHSRIAYRENEYLKIFFKQWYIFRPPSFNRVL